MWQPPKDPRPIRLDMSEFHALDHPVWRCTGYGGWRRHLSIAWDFGAHGRDYWMRPLWRLRCLFGRHRDALWFSDTWATVKCDGCGRTRVPSESELDEAPRFGHVEIINTEEEDSE